MTKFSFQVSIHDLETFHEEQDYIFALSFLCKYDKYLNYIKACSSSKMFTILDNSFCELGCSDSYDNLLRLFDDIKPDLIVSPDHHDWSTEETMERYFILEKRIPAHHILFVVRTDEMYDAAVASYIMNLAVPYNYRPHYHYPRNKYAHGIVSDKVLTHPGIHFLGYNCPDEILMYKPQTCDTTMPVKLGRLGISFDAWLKLECPHIHNRHFQGLLETATPLDSIPRVHKNMMEIKARS